MVSPQLTRQIFFSPSPRHRDYRRAQCPGVLDTQMPRATDSLYRDERPRRWPRQAERIEHGETSTEQWSGLYRIEIIRDGDEATGTHDDTLGIPAVGCSARPRLIGAVDEITPAAEDTDTVGSTEKADAN